MELTKQPERFICRVYVLRCQNLAATSSSTNIKDRLAGYTANCTSCPYLVLKAGKTGDSSGSVKVINERDRAQQNTLNPDIYQSYEFEIRFPEDWELRVEVLDANGYISDSLIGYTIIDLEDRYYGDPNLMARRTLEMHKKLVEDRMRAIDNKPNKKDRAADDLRMALKNRKTKINELLGELDSMTPPKVPVEFRELLHHDKKQSQGIIEMWTEVFPAREIKSHPLHTIKPPSKEEYEIRLIIWGTRDIKLVDGDKVDIFVKVVFDPSGWSGESIEKKTDTHYNSQDGRGEFNWRMKFNLEMPCEFPRLKFQVYDYNVFGDVIIGENILSLQKTLGKLQKEGEIDIPNAWINLENPEDPLENVGSLKFCMSIVTKMKAETTPVGEAWDEPNENPRLIPPTAGRSFGDKFAAMAFDVGKWKLPTWLFFRNFAIIGSVLSIVGMVGAILIMRMQ